MGTQRKVDKVEEAVTWYASRRSLYDALASKVEEIIKEVLDAKGIEYHSVASRAKDLEKFRAKAAREQYANPIEQIKDMAGIRAIAYVESEALRIADLVATLFVIDPKHSADKGQILGVDRVGYRSIHYVAKLPPQRCKLPEYRRFSKLEFEIQVRTILQHAWAEIEHDRNYKFTGILPDEIQRRFAVLAGVLELADREFDQIAVSIDTYARTVAIQATAGNLDIPVNTTSLREYMSKRFPQAVAAGLQPVFGSGDAGAAEIIQELHDFGISKLSDLDPLIPDDLDERVAKLGEGAGTFLGLLRYVMIFRDAQRYFRTAWKATWGGFGPTGRTLLESYGVNVAALVKKYLQPKRTTKTSPPAKKRRG